MAIPGEQWGGWGGKPTLHWKPQPIVFGTVSSVDYCGVCLVEFCLGNTFKEGVVY